VERCYENYYAKINPSIVVLSLAYLSMLLSCSWSRIVSVCRNRGFRNGLIHLNRVLKRVLSLAKDTIFTIYYFTVASVFCRL